MRNFITLEDSGMWAAYAHRLPYYEFGDTREEAMRELRSKVEDRMMTMEDQPEWDTLMLNALNDIVTDLDLELDRCNTQDASHHPNASSVA